MKSQIIALTSFLVLFLLIFLGYFFYVNGFASSDNVENPINFISAIVNTSDSLDKAGIYKKEILIKENGEKKYFLIEPNDSTPYNVEKTFTINKNVNDSIKLIGEYIQAESGDEYISASFYFDESEKTVAYKESISFFSEDCSPGVATKYFIEYFDEDFKSILKNEFIQNEKGDTIKNCGNEPFFQERKIPKDLNAFLSEYQIEKSNIIVENLKSYFAPTDNPNVLHIRMGSIDTASLFQYLMIKIKGDTIINNLSTVTVNGLGAYTISKYILEENQLLLVQDLTESTLIPKQNKVYDEPIIYIKLPAPNEISMWNYSQNGSSYKCSAEFSKIEFKNREFKVLKVFRTADEKYRTVEYYLKGYGFLKQIMLSNNREEVMQQVDRKIWDESVYNSM